MKILLLVISLFALSISPVGHAADTLPLVDGKINYSEIVTVEGASKEDLYPRAKLWIANTFQSSNDLILDDKKNGVILSKGKIEVIENETGVRRLFNTKPTVKKTWDFTVKIQMKSGKYKVEMYDIVYTYAMPGNNIGHTPKPRHLDTLFQDEEMYEDDGSLKDGAPLNIANWTNKNFNALLDGLEKAMVAEIVLDDF